MRVRSLAALMAGMVTMAGISTTAFAGDVNMDTVLVASGLQRPVGLATPDGDFNRVFVIEKRGRIRIIENGSLLATPFLDIDSLVVNISSGFDERGLLGLAFHPDYMSNGFFFVYYTNNSSNTVVRRYTVSGDPATSNVANLSSGTTILTATQPFSNHNGGWIGFGPNDGYLYISLGDGGSGGDPGDRSQNINNILGKMLRIDIDNGLPYTVPADNPFVGVSGLDEIWAYGLRNAWRNSFDPTTGELIIADVGQSAREEINLQRGSSTGGENYGWRCMEGSLCFTSSSGCTCNEPGLVLPIREYTHGQGCSITGGEVYQGCAMPGMEGEYFYADYCTDIIWSFRISGGSAGPTVVRTSELAPGGGQSITDIVSFGRDGYGEIYIVEQGSSSANGQVFKIVPNPGAGGPFFDCNNNSIEDGCEIADGSVEDTNGNGIPDVCDVPALDVLPDSQTATSLAVELVGTPDQPFSIRVVGDSENSDVSCVDAYVQADGTIAAGEVTQTLAEWGSNVTISDSEIIPNASYTISTEGFPSAPIDMTTLLYGDVNNNTFVNLEDAQLAIIDFQSEGFTAAADVDPCGGNGLINLADVLVIVQNWQQTLNYVQQCGGPCP
ncbi:MAG: PQQ-dependent sugar dehydrogenase [Phycisphaerae bacterium]